MPCPPASPRLPLDRIPLIPSGRVNPALSFGDISAAGFPEMQWDALPTASKLQILGAISLLEVFGEASYLTTAQGEKHYMMGARTRAKLTHCTPLHAAHPRATQPSDREHTSHAVL